MSFTTRTGLYRGQSNAESALLSTQGRAEFGMKPANPDHRGHNPRGKNFSPPPYLKEWLPVFPTPFNCFVPTAEKIHLKSFHFWVK
jgi:hypothetical protein